MKKKLSITVDEDKAEKIGLDSASGVLCNKSHFIEFTIDKFLSKDER